MSIIDLVLRIGFIGTTLHPRRGSPADKGLDKQPAFTQGRINENSFIDMHSDIDIHVGVYRTDH